MRGAVAFSGIAEAAIDATTAVLQRRGYQVTRSFDLQRAMGYHAENCPCPHHGTDECTCQYVVLLAYPKPTGVPLSPRVLTAHSYGNVTQVALHHDSSLDEEERFALISALIEAALLLSPEGPIVESAAQIPVPTSP